MRNVGAEFAFFDVSKNFTLSQMSLRLQKSEMREGKEWRNGGKFHSENNQNKISCIHFDYYYYYMIFFPFFLFFLCFFFFVFSYHIHSEYVAQESNRSGHM